MVDTSEAPVTSAAPPAPQVAAVCPYLLASDGRWRSATPAREHRCTAVVPPAVLAADKQRRLCLVAEHLSCATYQVATGHGDLIGTIDARQPDRVTGSGGRAIVRTAPLVLDHGRLSVVVPTITADRRLGQVALLGLMAIAFAAILFARLTTDDGGPSRPAFAGGAAATASAAATPGVTDPPEASGAPAPARTLVPTEVQPSEDPGATAEATAAPTEATPTEAPTTYKVRRGDTLSGIAAEFGTTVKVLSELNDIDDPSKLRVGQVLELP